MEIVWLRSLLRAVAEDLDRLGTEDNRRGDELRRRASRIRQRLHEGPPADGPVKGPAGFIERKRSDSP
jgi:hypothetical protein